MRLSSTKACMIPAARPGVKTDIVERFTISEGDLAS